MDFEDGKDDTALRTIGEVSNALGIKQHVLRYWEQQFAMLKPLKRSGGRRYYRPEDIALLETIDRLVNLEGYTLKGAKAALRSGKSAGSQAVSQNPGQNTQSEAAPPSNPADLVPQLKALRNRLAAIIEA